MKEGEELVGQGGREGLGGFVRRETVKREIKH